MKKSFIVGTLIGALLFGGIFSFAESIEVFFNKINVKVNGKKVDAENVLINGRTYVPLRAISDMLNKDVVWNGETSTAEINDKDYIDEVKTPGYSREYPADLNTAVKAKFYSGYDENFKQIEYSANITVKEIIRGDEAWNLIKAANQFNDEPESGFDYLVAKVNFELLEGKQQYDLNVLSFTLVSEEGKDYKYSMVVGPEPKIEAKLYKGASNEGYAVFKVAVTDSKPLITFGRDYKGNGGIWIKAYN